MVLGSFLCSSKIKLRITMKVLFIIAVVFVAVSRQELSEEQRERVRKFREDCTKETKVNPELIDRADRGDFSDDRNLKCFAKCFYLKAGFINDAAELQLDVIKSKIPKEANRERALEIIEKCKDVKGSDPCETAYAIHRCYFNSTRSIARKEDS